MDYGRFSKKELMEILDITQSAICCKNESDIKLLLERTKELLCGERSIGGLTLYESNGLPQVTNIINGSYPEGWFEAYREEKLYEIDPIVWHHHKFLGTQIWADTYKKYKKRVSPKFIYNADSFGLSFGIAGGMRSRSGGLTSIISFTNSKNHFKAHQKIIMDIITPHFHQALLRVCREKNARKTLSYLTPREREIVKWIVAGKTNWEISAILNISERTVRFHVESIKYKFDATNKAHVVAIAMEQEGAG